MNNQRGNEAQEISISVVMPVYNAERYVRESVLSILQQTFRDFELIIINDGSTDGTLEVLKEVKASDPRVVLISRENKGLVETLNEGISISGGKWIARMDADDISLPNRFERQLDWLEKTGADICGSWVRLFGTADERILKHSQSDVAIRMEMLFGTPFAHPSVMMRAALAKQLCYDNAWDKCEDYDLWERAAREGWKMANVSEVLLLYRQHDAQVSATAASRQQLLTQKVRYRYWQFLFESMKLDVKWIDEVLKLREAKLVCPDMNDVDSAFRALMSRCDGEAREVVWDHATRLYFRVAGVCPSTAMRWSRLNGEFFGGGAFPTKLKLLSLSLLRIQSGGWLFNFFKKIQMKRLSS